MMGDYPDWYGIANYRRYRRHRGDLRHCVFCALLTVSIACSLISIGMLIVILWG